MARLFRPCVADQVRSDQLLRCLREAYRDYRRLGRLLKSGAVRYGILRAVMQGEVDA
jgi:hypothetical protein